LGYPAQKYLRAFDGIRHEWSVAEKSLSGLIR
jgi:hypothetical protein